MDYIFADQLRASSGGCYQNDEASTPHIDRLSSEGVNFSNAVSTSLMCRPHRVCLMTRKYPTATGVVENDIKLHSDEACVVEMEYFNPPASSSAPNPVGICGPIGWLTAQQVPVRR